jgi:two-component system chemotaxis response regulator CheB
MVTGTVRVLIVDDSAVVRSILKSALTQHSAIQVVGVARDGVEALEQIRTLRPDVVTLDVEMPRMNGLEVLDRVGGKIPVSFVMCSTLTQAGARTTFEALRKGAFDYVAKPERGGFAGDPEFRSQLHQKIIAAASAKGRIRKLKRESAVASSATRRLPPNKVRGWVVGIGISCGGPQALCEILPLFPSDFVPIIITQHMPVQFTLPFAEHLDRLCAMRVRQAETGMPLKHGTILIAAGSHHLRLVRRGVHLCAQLDDGPKVSGHRPSVDVMFNSMARSVGPRCVAVIMTGMGADGVKGIQSLRNIGAHTIAQDEPTSLVYGMPKAAVATGSVERSVPLSQIPYVAASLMERGAVAATSPMD